MPAPLGAPRAPDGRLAAPQCARQQRRNPHHTPSLRRTRQTPHKAFAFMHLICIKSRRGNFGY
ncbi:MAG: hypothetical protein CVT82_01195 [Alphaproteobacteria bacterium HGW-Alphaproteobacteria-4]|nr:MAG: hypothetical protein CVT82_01195 [Alphaproteobacteria bacterium HGW-Alphaproteobacteria-4]